VKLNKLNTGLCTTLKANNLNIFQNGVDSSEAMETGDVIEDGVSTKEIMETVF
jgi:hypothetical protein